MARWSAMGGDIVPAVAVVAVRSVKITSISVAVSVCVGS